jgi:uroporphyrinogen III methyltransferase/synthase
LKQEAINALLITKAKENKTVVRLKGGDPFVFGRGGEEAAALEREGISFEIVPGITSAIAVPAYAGIPVTDRGSASSFAVITGHEDPKKTTSSIHWDKLATAVDTLVFLMGVHNLPYITEQLVKYGRPAQTPAALIRWGTKAEQETLITTVGNAAKDALEQQITPPAIFIVGDVVNLRRTISWFDTKPLFGQTILVTRTRTQASVLTAHLEELGANCIEVPTIAVGEPSDDYQSLDKAIDKLATYSWLIFTSTNGVEAFFRRLAQHHLDSRALGRARIAVIGSATQAELAKHGLQADIVPHSYQAEALAASLLPHIKATDRILIPRAKEARTYLPEELAKSGAAVHIAEAYQTVPAVENKGKIVQLLQDGAIDMVTFTSSSTVHSFVAFLDGNTALLENLTFACIGPITAQTCADYALQPVITADTFTIAGLTEKIKEWKMISHEN